MNELAAWRQRHRYTLLDMSDLLDLNGKRTYQRYETGERAMPAATIERLRVLTLNELTGSVMNEIRVDWLREYADLASEQDMRKKIEARIKVSAE